MAKQQYPDFDAAQRAADAKQRRANDLLDDDRRAKRRASEDTADEIRQRVQREGGRP